MLIPNIIKRYSLYKMVSIITFLSITLCALYSCSPRTDPATKSILDLLADDPPLSEFKERFNQAIWNSGDQELIELVESLLHLIADDNEIQEFRDAKNKFASKFGVDPTDLTGMVTKSLDKASDFLFGQASKKSSLKPEEVMQKMILKVLAQFLQSNSEKIKKMGIKGFLTQFLSNYEIPKPGIGAPSGSSPSRNGRLRVGDCVFQQFTPDDLIARAMFVKAELFGEIVDISGNMAKVYWKRQNAYAADRTNLGKEFLGKTTEVPVKYLNPCSTRGARSISDVLRGY